MRRASTTATPTSCYVTPERSRAELHARARMWLSALPSDQPIEFRAQAADTAARSLAEAEPELERLVRSGYRTVVAWPRRSEGERAAYNLARADGRRGSARASAAPATSGRALRRRRACARASSPRDAAWR